MEVLKSDRTSQEATLLHRAQRRITLHKRLFPYSQQEYTTAEAMSPNVFPNRVDFRPKPRQRLLASPFSAYNCCPVVSTAGNSNHQQHLQGLNQQTSVATSKTPPATQTRRVKGVKSPKTQRDTVGIASSTRVIELQDTPCWMDKWDE